MTREDFLRGLVRERRPLLDAMIAFQLALPGRLNAEAVRPEALPLLPLLREPAASARAADRVGLLLAGGGARAVWAADLRLPRHRLILLPPETLLRLARWCGLVRLREEVLSLIDATAIRALREEVGEEGRHFLLRRSRFLPGPRAEPDAPQGLERAPLGVRLRRSGFDAIAACLGDASPPTRELFRSVLPGDFSAPFPPEPEEPSAALPENATRFWPLLRAVLFKEVAPAWEPCFS
jgi:hypothetical protein